MPVVRMSQESLSALFDGECSDAELEALLKALDAEPALKASWSRQSLMRDVLRGQSLKTPPVDICAGVMAAIQAGSPERSDKVVSLSGRRAVRNRRTAWQPMAGLAAAAAVGAIAITLGVNYGRVQNAAPAGQLSASAADVQAVKYQPVAETDEDLRNYLIEHSNTLADRGVGGALSYARFAAHSGEAYAQPASLSYSGSQP